MKRIIILIALISTLQVFGKLNAHKTYPSLLFNSYPSALKQNHNFVSFRVGSSTTKIVSQCLNNYLTYCNTISMIYTSATTACVSEYADSPTLSLQCQFAAADTYALMHSIGDNAYNICTGNGPTTPPQN